MQMSAYWYWISGNVSKEGIIRDLESMKEVGINRAFIGNIGLPENEAPPGPVKLFSDEWWELTHTALKKAGELGIDIGMFNCPGWSQAGGPWIEAGESMRYLATTRTRVKGGSTVTATLPRNEGPWQDVKVVAFPYKGEDELVLDSNNASFSSIPALSGIERMFDRNPETGVSFDGGGRILVDIASKEEFVLRSLSVYPAERPIRANAEMQVQENGGYRTVASFEINRTNPNTEVGFEPYAPVVISVPETAGKNFRFVLSGINGGAGITELELSSVPRVERYPEKTLAKMFQEPLPCWHEYMWGEQPDATDGHLTINPNEIIDLTAMMDGDRLTWNAPDGEWVVLRTGMVPTGVMNAQAAPEGLGLEVDKLTSRYLQKHFDSFLGEIMRRIPAEDRKTLKVVVADSYERGGQNFTDTFFEDFREHFGYDAEPFLPVYSGYVVGNRDLSDRFLWDLRRFVADKISYEHIAGMRKVANQNGLTLWLENYGHWGFPGEFLQYGGQSDEISGEFWSEGTLGDIENRAATSCGHIYGKQKISAESFTCGFYAYSRYPATMKQRGDLFFSEGINNSLLHVFISQHADAVPPGMNAPFGNEFNRLNTWYPHLDLFTDYLKRVNYMLQQGLNIADVAYFIGEDAPKMTGVTDPPMPAGYQFDYINSEVILESMSIRDGKWTLPHGTQYSLLVLPKQTTMRPELVEKLEKLVREGGMLLGPAPERSPSLEGYPEADRRVAETASRMWEGVGNGSCYAQYGKGIVMSGLTAAEALELAGCIADCAVPEDIPVLYGHRQDGARHIYFLTNQSDRKVSFNATFRVTGMQPELWNPVDGDIRPLPEYTTGVSTTTVPLKLAPNESTFIVFTGKQSNRITGENYPKMETVTDLSTDWELTFNPEMRGPAGPVGMETLTDLSTHSDEKIKYYSGIVIYSKTFELGQLPEDEEIWLDVTKLSAMGKVYINGIYAGGLWTYPYCLNVTDYLRQGENRLDIEVTTTWVNRLIGDSKLPVAERKTHTPNNPYGPDSPLHPSGITGSAALRSVAYIR